VLLDALDAGLQEFRLQFGRFFAGDLPTPPEELRQQLLARLRAARGGTGSGHGPGAVRSVADTFRLTQLEAQFNTYNELFNRRLRRREEGPRRSGTFAAGRPASRPVRDAAPAPRPVAPAPEPGSLSSQRIEELHRQLYPRGAHDGAPDLAQFGALLSSQAESLRQRTGCRDVTFRVSEDGGRRRLLVKAVAGPLTD
jgi:hypothetical protein